MKEWTIKAREKLKQGKVLYLAGGFKESNKVVIVTEHGHSEVHELESDHEEADSQMFVHISHAKHKYGIDRTIIWSLDTDVAVLSVHYWHALETKELFFKTGFKQKRRYIPVHLIAQNLGRNISLILPAVHSLSGCDSTSSFSHIGKARWLDMVIDHPELHEGLLLLGDDPTNIKTSALKASTQLVALMYTPKSYPSLDAIRYACFSKKCLKK